MNVLKNVVAKAPYGVLHAAAIVVLGCSAGAGDSSLDDGTPSAVTQDLHLRGNLAMRKGPHHPVPPPHHHGHGPPPPPGAAGSAGSSSGGGETPGNGGALGQGGFSSGTGGAPELGGAAGFGGGFNDPCGDGVAFFNACDDGNTVSGDGCSATCDVEPGYSCTPGQPCRLQRCGDGFQDYIFIPGDPSSGTGGVGGFGGGSGSYIYEACDDGNTVSGDGCSDTCAVEDGFVCTSPGTLCHQPRCGDGFQDFIPGPGGTGGASSGTGGAGGSFGGAAGSAGAAGSGTFESCDDGNTVSGDGCSSSCELEPGYICQEPNTPCRVPRCGDGFQDFIPGSGGGVGGAPNGEGGLGGAGGSAGSPDLGSFESCDDGNAVSGDGCSSECQVEPGYICIAPDYPCRAPHCGDGIVDYFYPGTDTGGGGAAGSAGSSASAGFGGVATGGEGGFGAGGIFGAGGGFAGGPGFGGVEQCDDGNTESGDGCSATCQVE